MEPRSRCLKSYAEVRSLSTTSLIALIALALLRQVGIPSALSPIRDGLRVAAPFARDAVCGGDVLLSLGFQRRQ